jgi:acylaminoacyl-peptidase
VREITPDGAVSVPLIFPDGKRIAYASNNGLVIMNIDGSNPKIISSEIVGGEPALSPGGNMFAYYKTRDDGHILLESDIYVMNVDGTGKKKLTESGNKMAMEPSWSSDGNKIAVFYYGTGEIGVIEIEKSI